MYPIVTGVSDVDVAGRIDSYAIWVEELVRVRAFAVAACDCGACCRAGCPFLDSIVLYICDIHVAGRIYCYASGRGELVHRRAGPKVATCCSDRREILGSCRVSA